MHAMRAPILYTLQRVAFFFFFCFFFCFFFSLPCLGLRYCYPYICTFRHFSPFLGGGGAACTMPGIGVQLPFAGPRRRPVRMGMGRRNRGRGPQRLDDGEALRGKLSVVSLVHCSPLTHARARAPRPSRCLPSPRSWRKGTRTAAATMRGDEDPDVLGIRRLGNKLAFNGGSWVWWRCKVGSV
ncbi:hypothetical protein LY76DRAFT_36427 [Colletotrichum caudatum]|nr:hypothetical protein LY76DRAFT_36427 [Colletotrichum caudatum]